MAPKTKSIAGITPRCVPEQRPSRKRWSAAAADRVNAWRLGDPRTVLVDNGRFAVGAVASARRMAEYLRAGVAPMV
jgi:hypothetical protein